MVVEDGVPTDVGLPGLSKMLFDDSRDDSLEEARRRARGCGRRRARRLVDARKRGSGCSHANRHHHPLHHAIIFSHANRARGCGKRARGCSDVVGGKRGAESVASYD